MFMNGIIKPAAQDAHEASLRTPTLRRRLYAFRYFIALVLLPTLLAASYYYLIASDQYESSADFIVRRADSPTKSANSLGSLMGFSSGVSATTTDAMIVSDYLESHNTVERLQKEDRLVGRYRRADIDLLSALWSDTPSPEVLLKYYRKHVKVEQNIENGITQLRVKAFTPEDSYHIAQKLLLLGEERVNQINERAMQGQLAAAQEQLKAAEKDMLDIQNRLTAFRRTKGDIDPAGTGKAQIGLVSNLTASLVAVRARLNSLDGLISRSSPQYKMLQAQARELEEQVAAQSAKLTSGAQNIANGLGPYEDLVVRQEFAAKRYAAAAAAYEQARSEAIKQQLYLARVVDPNKPVEALYPERGRIVLTIFFSLLVAYGIGWMLLAGIKEHKL